MSLSPQKLHSIFPDGLTIYTEDAALSVHVMSVHFTHPEKQQQQTNKQKNPNQNKSQPGLNGTKTNKTGQKHLNVNKHQSDQAHQVKGWGQKRQDGRKVRLRWRATLQRSSAAAQQRSTSAGWKQRCRGLHWWSSDHLDCGTGLIGATDQRERF